MNEDKSALVREVETLGDDSNYKGQAQAFMRRTGTKIEARYLGTFEHFPGESRDDARDVYEVRIVRGTRAHTFEYGDSIKNTEQRIASLYPDGSPRAWRDIRINGGVPQYKPIGWAYRFPKWHKDITEWAVAGESTRPDAYSILASLTTTEPPASVDDFAAEYGYDKPSVALKVFEAVQKEYAAMQSLYNDDELLALSLIS